MLICIRDVLQTRERVMDLRGGRGHLPAQADIHGEVRPQAPVILSIKSEHTLPEPALFQTVGQTCLKTVRLVAEEVLKRAEKEAAALIARNALVQLLPLKRDSKFQGVCAPRVECVVIGLIRIPGG